jgi:hypothetical protein
MAGWRLKQESYMKSVPLESGICLGIGGTNARYAECKDGDIAGFTSVETPERPREFFGWMARQALKAADAGHAWMVAGYPGPVSKDGRLVGPLTNVPGLAESQYDVIEEMAAADSAAGKLFEQGFRVVNANDGSLAAQAAASRIGNNKYRKVAALIDGTGVGAGVVTQDGNYESVYRTVEDPLEIGHLPASSDPYDTYEQRISGPALERTYGMKPKHMKPEHPAWRKVGTEMGQLAVTLGLTTGADLVVPCGGVGAGASGNYGPHLADTMHTFREYGNGPQKQLLPEVIPVPSADAQTFELYGAEGIMRDAFTR